MAFERMRALDMLKAGRNVSDIADRLKVTPAAVYSWKREFVKAGWLTVEKRGGGRIARCICKKCKVRDCERKQKPSSGQAIAATKIEQASVRWRHEPGNEVPEQIKPAESSVEREKSKTVLTAEEMRKYRQGLKS